MPTRSGGNLNAGWSGARSPRRYADGGRAGSGRRRRSRRLRPGEADFGALAAERLRAEDQDGAVRLGDGLDDRQPEAEPLPVTRAVTAEPLEGLEQPVNGADRDDRSPGTPRFGAWRRRWRSAEQ